jgi:hypothetical protein
MSPQHSWNQQPLHFLSKLIAFYGNILLWNAGHRHGISAHQYVVDDYCVTQCRQSSANGWRSIIDEKTSRSNNGCNLYCSTGRGSRSRLEAKRLPPLHSRRPFVDGSTLYVHICVRRINEAMRCRNSEWRESSPIFHSQQQASSFEYHFCEPCVVHSIAAACGICNGRSPVVRGNNSNSYNRIRHENRLGWTLVFPAQLCLDALCRAWSDIVA